MAKLSLIPKLVLTAVTSVGVIANKADITRQALPDNHRTHIPVEGGYDSSVNNRRKKAQSLVYYNSVDFVSGPENTSPSKLNVEVDQ